MFQVIPVVNMTDVESRLQKGEIQEQFIIEGNVELAVSVLGYAIATMYPKFNINL